jgi:outer membrane protein assembly factor BamD
MSKNLRSAAALPALALVAAAALCPWLGACSSARPDASYSDSARAAFDEAMEAFEDEDYLEAVKRLTTVKNKYAYSRWAALAELRIADAYYEQDKWIEAIDAYRTFAQSRPNHPEVPYALYRVGRSYYEQMPSDFFILPPVHERDPAATKDTLRALETFVERYPENENAADARERIRTCRQLLADQEMYVARFYLHQERPVSARGRLERVVADYPDLEDRWAEAALLLVRVYADASVGLTGEAREMAQRLIRERPTTPEAQEARDLLARLPVPPTPPASASPTFVDPGTAPPPAPASGG